MGGAMINAVTGTGYDKAGYFWGAMYAAATVAAVAARLQVDRRLIAKV
jgi:hypothetical protein